MRPTEQRPDVAAANAEAASPSGRSSFERSGPAARSEPARGAFAPPQPSPHRDRFVLRKYYADGVTACGSCFIGYHADLRFKGLSIGGAATLATPELTGLDRGPRFGKGPAPVHGAGRLAWRQPSLGFDGVWHARARPLRIELLRNGAGVVDWHCLQPAANVWLRTSSGLELALLGYAEVLTLTLPPWSLGLAELIWGRFVSASQSLVWIEWKGANALRLAYWNGVATTPLEISGRRLRSAEFELAIEPVRTLRERSLGDTVLSRLPLAGRLAPLGFFSVKETKWLARGVLQTSDGRRNEGWIIHETVTWPKSTGVAE